MSEPTAVAISPLVQTDEGRLRAVRLDNGSCAIVAGQVRVSLRGNPLPMGPRVMERSCVTRSVGGVTDSWSAWADDLERSRSRRYSEPNRGQFWPGFIATPDEELARRATPVQRTDG